MVQWEPATPAPVTSGCALRDQAVVTPGHHEEFPHHATALANVLLHQLTARHPDEGAVGVVRHCSGQQRLASSRRAIQQHTLQVASL